MISIAALRGLVLEEALARLLLENGYRLLTSEGQDPDALRRGRHGLLVRGRGSDHQADALGELLTPTPFGLPVRLFVEAKFRAAATGLNDARNAHGVLDDVNEHYTTDGARRRRIPLRRHEYRYSLFSTSGFTRNAQRYALAQQISLVDLSGPAFIGLRGIVARTAEALIELANESGVQQFPTGLARAALRLALGTFEVGAGDSRAEFPSAFARARQATELNQAVAEADQQLPADELASIAADLAEDIGDSLLLGFPCAPFVLVLRPDDLESFDRYVERYGTDISVRISFARRGDVGGDWVLTPTAGTGFRLRFGLPGVLEEWLLATDGVASIRARDAKQTLLSTITVFRPRRTVRLSYEPHLPMSRAVAVGGVNQDGLTPFREALAEPDLALNDDQLSEFEALVAGEIGHEENESPVDPHRLWTADAIRELLRRLESGNSAKARVLKAAARLGGAIERDEVYRVARYEDRSLRGFTRPFNRITRELIEEGLLQPDTPTAIKTIYPKGGVHAIRFVVRSEIVEYLRNEPDLDAEA